MKILGISGTITGSKTLVVINHVIEQMKRINPSIETEILDLKQFDVQFCDGRPPSEYTGDTRKVIDMVTSADAYVIGTPIFQGSMTGALKNLIDLVPPSEFNQKVMGFAATGGNQLHYLVVENQLKPIAGYLQAYVPPSYVFAINHQFNQQNEIQDPDLLDQMNEFGKQFLLLLETTQQASKNTI